MAAILGAKSDPLDPRPLNMANPGSTGWLPITGRNPWRLGRTPARWPKRYLLSAIYLMRAVAIVVFGQSAFTAMRSFFISSESPSTTMLMPNFAME